MRARRVLIGGLPFFGRMLVQLLASDGWELRYLESPGFRPSGWAAAATAICWADVIYLIGGQLGRWTRPDLLTHVGRRPLVMHWVGSDVLFAREAARKGNVSDRLTRAATHWAEVDWIANEVRQLGIDVAIVPLTSTRLPAKIAPMPKTFTILTYLPDDRPDFYGRDLVQRLAEQFPGVHLLVAGGTGKDWSAPPNVEHLGWVENMDDVYARTSVLVRMPEHDGLSFMVLEALAAGRHVVWNHQFPGVLAAETESDAITHLQRLLSRNERAQLGLNDDGRTAVEEQYRPESVRIEILKRLAAVLDSPD